MLFWRSEPRNPANKRALTPRHVKPGISFGYIDDPDYLSYGGRFLTLPIDGKVTYVDDNGETCEKRLDDLGITPYDVQGVMLWNNAYCIPRD